MKKLFLILYLLFLSCDSSELFGVHELDDTTLDYYDYIARGWGAIFNQDYDLATSDFKQATLLDSTQAENKNSAYVGLGWTATFAANAFFDSTQCFSSNDIECVDVVNNLRLDAIEYFNLATESCLDSLGQTMPGWDNTEIGCSDDYQYSNVANAIVEYTDCKEDYVNCFEEFNKDLEIGKLYLDLLEFNMQDYDLFIPENYSEQELIIDNFEQFLLDYPDYDIDSNKPTYVDDDNTLTLNFDYQNIAALTSKLLLRTGRDCAAEYYLQVNDVCEDYSLGSDRLYSFTGLTENDEIVDDCGILTEIKFDTGYSRTLIDFTFYDTNGDLINVEYYDNGDDPNNEITDGCNLPEYTVSYANLNTDQIIYNIPENIKEFKLKFHTYLSEGEEFSGYDSNFEYIHGCYNPGLDNTTSDDDECLCEDVDEILILQCLQSSF